MVIGEENNTFSIKMSIMIACLSTMLFSMGLEAKILKTSIAIETSDASLNFKIKGRFSPYQVDFIRKDLIALSNIQAPTDKSGTPLHYRVFRSFVDGKAYIDWLAARVKGFKFSRRKVKRGPVIAPGGTYNEIGSKNISPGWLTLTDKYFAIEQQAMRWAKLIHHARLIEGFARVRCSESIKALNDWDQLYFISPRGKRLCDRSLDGGNGAELIFLLNLKNVFPAEYTWIDSRFLESGGRIELEVHRRMLNHDLIGPVVKNSLTDALYLEQFDKVEGLLKKGVSGQELDRAMDVAMYKGQFRFFKLLIQYGHKKSYILEKLKENNLWKYELATTELENLRFILEELRYPINHQNVSGYTLLHYMCSVLTFSAENIEYILEKEADSYLKNNLGEDPLELYKREYPDNVEYFQELMAIFKRFR